MTPRCILFNGPRRCHRPAAKRMGDLYCCASHGRITLLLLDATSVATRKMLACSRWESPAEGQRRIDKMYRTRAA